MDDTFRKNPLLSVDGLFCPDTLRTAMRATQQAPVDAREGLKELLSNPGPAASAPTADLAADATAESAPGEPEFSRWERCLDVLVEEFLLRKFELLRLNKARKTQIETFLKSRTQRDIPLEEAVQARVGTPEHEGLQLFAYQACVFHLLQVFLLKRWSDRGLVSRESLRTNAQSVNWQITSFLKKHSPKGLMGRHDWSFLKQNLFSWFSPSAETWERLRLLLEPVDLSLETADFPARLLAQLGQHSRLSLLGFRPQLADSRALWHLLLQQKVLDLRLDSLDDLDFSSISSSPVLVSGLRNGECLSALRELSSRQEIHGVWAFTDSEFERYLSEMFILWDCAAGVPRINIHSRSTLRDLSRDAVKAASLFTDGQRTPYQAQLAASFQDEPETEMEDTNFLLDQLKENGLLMLVSSQFWPTDPGETAEKLRDLVLKKAAVRLIIDLRQLSGNSGEKLPKAVFVLEKCSSKEIRDSNRPLIVRARGHLDAGEVQGFWAAVLESIRYGSVPGEVQSRPLPALGEGLRLELMDAAASQQELRATPWITLSDPAFFQASGRLKRSPSRAHNFCTILRWKPGMKPPSQRVLLLREHARTLVADLPGDHNGNENVDSEAHQYLFVPENGIAEQPDYFVAQIHSAPIQFWFRLEQEQKAGKRQKQAERQSEQRLKMMPLVRLFEPGALVPVAAAAKPVASLSEARGELAGIFRKSHLGMAERAKLHEIICGLEHSIRQNIAVCADFTHHLFPQLSVGRVELPGHLPEIAPSLAMDIFRHLDRSPVSHHPSIHVAKLRTAHDFKVTNASLQELSSGTLAELKVYHGGEAVLRLSGPTLLLRAALEEIQKRVGRPWRETAERLLLPTDFMLVQTQLKEVTRSIESQLQLTRDHQALLDQAFCCLLGLTGGFEDESVRIAMRRHLSPDEGHHSLRFDKLVAPFKTEDAVAPTGILH